MKDPDVSFIVTAKGTIELLAESKGNAWVTQITKDGDVRLFRNMQKVEAFPSTPLTKKLMAATEAIHQEAVAYLIKSWELGRPWDDAEGSKAWWKMKEKIERF